MAELASGQRVASPVKQPVLAQPPITLRPISKDLSSAWKAGLHDVFNNVPLPWIPS